MGVSPTNIDDETVDLNDILEDVDASIGATLDRLGLVKIKLADMNWDRGSDDLRDSLIELETILQKQMRVRKDFRHWLRLLRKQIPDYAP